jgi:hypothetical protein
MQWNAAISGMLSLSLLCFAGCATSSPDESVPDPTGQESGEATATGAEETGGDAPVAPTWHGEVKEILANHCWHCHQEGGIGPFDLTTYAEVEPMASFILSTVEDGTMPPYLAATECIDYRDAHIPLSKEQLATLTGWVESGMPEGESEGAPLEVTDLPALEREDLIVEIPSPHVPIPPDGSLDEQRCFVLDWPLENDTYVTGYHVLPGNKAIVHHAIAAIIPPENVASAEAADAAHEGVGYPCGQLSLFGLEGEEGGLEEDGTGLAGIFLGGIGQLFDKMQGQGLLALWAPGGGAARFPEGTGVLVRGGSRILLNTHYNLALTGLNPEPDQTRIAFMVEDEVDHPGVTMVWTNPSWLGGQMDIPANEPAVDHAFDFPLSAVLIEGESFQMYTAAVHMHYLGVAGNMTLLREDGTEECVIDVPRWDFDWQRAYEFVEPITVNPLDSLRLSCRFDNSASNQPILDGEKIMPQDVNWGDNTTDEMCLGFFFMSR